MADSETIETEKRREDGLWSGLWVICAALLSLFVLGLFGIPRALDAFLFEHLSAWRPRAPLSQARVVGIEAREGDLIDPAFVGALNAAQPERKILLFLPEDAAVQRALAAQGDWLLGRALLAQPDDTPVLQAVPPALAALPWAVTVAPGIGDDGLLFQRTAYELGGHTHPSLAQVAAFGTPAGDGARRFRVRFPAADRYAAVFDATDVAAGAVPHDLLAGKIIVIARHLPEEVRAFHRLTTPAGRRLSQLEYTLAAVDTVLRRAAPWEADRNLIWLFLIVAVFVPVIGYQRLQTRTALRVVVLVSVALPVPAWLLLFFDIWFFAAELMLLNLLVFLFLMIQENLILAGSLNRQILDTSAFMQSRYTPKSFYASDQHWSQVANMIKQMLHIRRTIFLDRVVGDHRCREVIALNCSLEDIYEMRRDYERTPYTIALDANGPIRMQRPYLKDQPENEAQFLIPLVFAGEVNGFWALGIEEENIGDPVQFEAALGETAVEIAEMLYHRRRYLQASEDKSLLPELFAFNLDREAGQLLRESTALMERHVLRFESIFHGQNTGVLIYDIFGQVLMINDGMADALSGVGFAPYDNTLADLLMMLGDYQDVDAKRLVLDILRLDQTFSFPLNLENGRSVLLVLRPLRSLREELDASPFSKLGILCEMVDITDLARLSQIKEKMIRQTTMVLRNDIMGLSMAHELITRHDVPEADKIEMMGIANEKMASLKQLLEEGGGYLRASAFDGAGPYFPIEFGGVLESVLTESQKLLDQRNLRLEIEKPELINFVLASPNQLKGLLLAVFQLLADDAEKMSAMSLRISEKDGLLNLALENQGYGIPERQLAKILGDAPDLDLRAGRELKKYLQYVDTWQGSYELTSEIGRGTACTISLKVFG